MTPTRSTSPTSPNHDDVADGWAAVRKALLVAYFGSLALLITACAVFLLFAPPAEAQEIRHSPERITLIHQLQEQDRFLAEETDRILGELAQRDEPSFWTARQALAWIEHQSPKIRRLEEIVQERRRNLSALYCDDFDRYNSLGLYSLGKLALEIGDLDLWPSERLRRWENIDMFFGNVESARRQARETSSDAYHAYVVLSAFGGSCSDGS